MKKYLLIGMLLLLVLYPMYGQDKDGDSVENVNDLDSDNDGILDADECYAVMSFANASLHSGSSINNLQVNDKVLYSNAVTVESGSYDIILTILEKAYSSMRIEALPALKMNTNSSPDNYLVYRLDLIQAGSVSGINPNGISATINNFMLKLQDIDSSQYYDFTEVVGYLSGAANSPDSHLVTSTTNLEQAGFSSGNGPSGSYVNFRLDPATVGNTSTWYDEGNNTDGSNDHVLFLNFNAFSGVTLVFGLKGAQYTGRLAKFGGDKFCDDDSDGVFNRYDIDSDDDGIPDNVEAQPTVGYVAPSASVNAQGVPTNYASTPLVLQDTDGDGIKDFIDTDTDNDGRPDIEENGMANAVIPLDTDNDGLDNNFEGSNVNDPTDINDEINNPQSSILPDGNGDVLTGGDLDYRDIVSHTECTVYFDGVDDYLSSNIQMKGYQQATLMAWIKLDDNFINEGTIAGEAIFGLYVSSDKKVKLKGMFYKNSGGYNTNYSIISEIINKNQWYHIAGVYDGTTGDLSLLINGEQVSTFTPPNVGPGNIATSESTNFAIGRQSNPVGKYFKGAIDEVRLFDKALTQNQIQKMIYQEIANQSGIVKGKIIPKPIRDANTGANVSWNSLQAYYPMTQIKNSVTSDASSYGRNATLHNITNVQEQTAPMPFITSSSGTWGSTSTWVNGSVCGISDMEDWSIVKLNHDIAVSSSQGTSGLIVAPGVKLTVNGNHAIGNSWYLQLDGTIDLQNDSQLVQGAESNLVTSATGKILRRQEGSNSKYWYNYWASPIGAPSASSFNTNENALSTNNINNTGFSLNTLKDQGNTALPFTTALDETGKLSTRWLYTYKGGTGYPGWIKLTETSGLTPGQGYCHKGTGNTSGTGNTTTQQGYLFEGKPNNGTVALDVAVSGSSLSAKYLVGNPYPSAIDAREFINDNSSVIEGTLYFWEQWAGNTHYLNEYEGGYGTVNLTATVKAYQYNDYSKRGAKIPTFNIPVSQGFFVKAKSTGKVVFRNSQRVYASESDGGSVFMRTTSEEKPFYGSNNPNMSIIRLEFTSSNNTVRELVLGFGDKATDGYDNGYDGKMRGGLKDNDLCTKLDGRAMIIQAYSELTPYKEVDLVLHTTNDNLLYGIKMLEAFNIDENQPIYLRDNETGTYFDLRSPNSVYNFTSALEGEDASRFSVVFNGRETLQNEDASLDSALIYINNSKLYIKNIDESSLKGLKIIDMLGKQVKAYSNINSNVLEQGVSVSGLSSGSYIVQLEKYNNVNTSKKIIIK